MKKEGDFLDRISSFTLLFTMLVLMTIGAALIPFVDVADSPKPRQGKSLNIQFAWPNASPKVVEQNVTSRIEGLVSSVKGVKEVSSVSRFGSGEILIELKKEVDVSSVKFEISSLLKQVWKKLPEGVSYPNLSGGEVVRNDVLEESSTLLLTYQVNSNLKDEQLKEYVQRQIEPRLRSLEDVKRIEVTGGTDKYIEIKYDPLALSQYGLTGADIESGIKRFMGQSDIVGSVFAPDADGEKSRTTLYLYTSPFTKELGGIPLKTLDDGKIIYLNDLATYEYKDRLPGSYYRVNGLNTIYLNIYVDAQANQIYLSSHLADRVEQVKGSLRDGVYLTLTYDAAKEKKNELWVLLSRSILSLFILLGLAWLVRRNGKYISILSLTLLADVLMAVIVYVFFDIRLHTFSLAGVTVSLSLIIDASIVMVDHYSYYRDRKAFFPILAALLTTIGSLVVVFFMPEYIQKDLYDFSWVIIINLSVALTVSLFFVPSLVQRLRYDNRRSATRLRHSQVVVRWTRFYTAYLRFTQKRKWIYFISLLLLFGIPFFALPDEWGEDQNNRLSEEAEEPAWYARLYNATLGSSTFQNEWKEPLSLIFGGTMRLFANSLDDNTYGREEEEMKLYIRAQMPLGASAAELNEKVRILENFLVGFPEIARFETRVDYWGAAITVQFKKEYLQTSFPYILESKVIGKVISIGGTDWSTRGVSEKGFSNSLNLQYRSHRIEIAGYNYDHLYRFAEEICDKLRKNNRIMDIQIETPGFERQEDEFYMTYRKDRMALYQVSPYQVHDRLKELLRGVELGHYSDNSLQADLRLQSVQVNRFDMWNLENSYLTIGDRPLRPADFMQVNRRQAKNHIPKKNQEYVLRVAFNCLGSYTYASRYIEDVTTELNQKFPVGYRCTNSTIGWYKDDGTQYVLILVIVIIIFFMCAVLFESLRLPWVIISLIPVSFIGTFLTFYFSGVPFGTGGFASLILLSGLVINAGIYLLAEYRGILSKKSSMQPLRCYVRAYNHKIVPVFLTVFSTIFGLIPFLFDGQDEPFWFSFAVGTIGGLLFSFLAFVFVMPIFLPLRPPRRSA